MLHRHFLASAVLATALSAAGGGAASASTLVIGGGAAKDCSIAALGGRSDPGAMVLCNQALETETLNFRDRARTHVNRGVMQLRRRAWSLAREDFDAASKIDPQLGEAYVNRGAAYVGERRYEEGLKAIDRGLELGVKDPEKALFNRALANEGLGDVTAAYKDYSRAAELDPDWAAPKTELARFTVKRP